MHPSPTKDSMGQSGTPNPGAWAAPSADPRNSGFSAWESLRKRPPWLCIQRAQTDTQGQSDCGEETGQTRGIAHTYMYTRLSRLCKHACRCTYMLCTFRYICVHIHDHYTGLIHECTHTHVCMHYTCTMCKDIYNCIHCHQGVPTWGSQNPQVLLPT